MSFLIKTKHPLHFTTNILCWKFKLFPITYASHIYIYYFDADLQLNRFAVWNCWSKHEWFNSAEQNDHVANFIGSISTLSFGNKWGHSDGNVCGHPLFRCICPGFFETFDPCWVIFLKGKWNPGLCSRQEDLSSSLKQRLFRLSCV